jgi:putative inorganic carbon (HCO3(-)) transporter
VATVPRAAPARLQASPYVGQATGLLLILALTGALFFSLVASVAPTVLLAYGAGVVVAVLAINPSTRFASLIGIFMLAPLLPYLRTFTGIREGPASIDVAMIVLFLVLLGDHLLSRRLTLDWLELVIAAYVALGLLQIFNPLSPGLSDALESFRRLVLPAVGFFLGMWMIRSLDDVKVLLIALAAVSLFVAAFAVKQSLAPSAADWNFVRTTIGSPTTYTSLGRFRAFSTLSSPAHLAYLMTFMLLLFFALYATKSIPRLWFVLGVLLLAAGSIVSIVRVGWVGTVAGVLVMFVLAPRLSKGGATRRLLLAAAAFAGLLFYVLVVVQPDPAMATRFRSLANLPAEPHYMDRVTSWKDTIVPAIRTQPLGYGLGSDSTSSDARYYAHNGYFYIAIEMGVVAVLMLLVIMGAAFLRAYRGLRQRGPPLFTALHLWIACWTVALLVMATFGDLVEVYPVNLYYWFFFGAICALARRQRQDAEAEEPVPVEGPGETP